MENEKVLPSLSTKYKTCTNGAGNQLSHNVVMMERCKDDLEQGFYIQMTKKYGWTKNVLIHQIEGKSYEKFLLNQTNFDEAVPEKYLHQAILAVKDEYNFEFLGISEEYNEKELELALMKNVRHFLSEMGGDFAFIGNQYRLEVGTKSFYVEYSLKNMNNPIGVATYTLTKTLPREYQNILPSPSEIEEKLSGFIDALIVDKNEGD